MKPTEAPELQNDPILAEIVRRLVEAYHPERVYLFGSHARGEAGPDSDYDLMVVPDDAPPSRRRSDRGYRALVGMGFGSATDVLVWTREDFQKRLHLKASLPSTIACEGRLLYGALSPCPRKMVQTGAGEYAGVRTGVRTPAYSSSLTYSECPVLESHPSMALDPVRVADTRAWLTKAASDLRGAEIDLAATPPLLDDLAFHCQQAAEKAFKAFLTWHDEPLRKTHNLREVGDQCAAIDPTLAPLVLRATPLTKYVWQFRYPGNELVPTLEQSAEVPALAREVVEAVHARLPMETRP